MNNTNWIKSLGTNLKNKTVIVTGASGGIGFEIVKHLIVLEANVIVTTRGNKLGQLTQRILSEHSTANITEMQLDVSSLKSIDAFVAEIEKNKVNVNYLINNAGIYKVNKSTTEEGFEVHFATNYLGPMYLSLKLLPVLNKNKNARIIFQSSIS